MWKRIGIVAGLAAATCGASNMIVWPDLPKTGFIAGRAATVADVDRGDAVFSMDGKGKGALTIAVPQYAMWTDERGAKHPMILVQAERAPNDLEVVGLRDFAGNATAATMPEVILLGTGKPH